MTEEIPEWSGETTQLSSELGLMVVAYADPRTHRAPDGWVLSAIEQFDDFEAYTYRIEAADG